MHTSSYSAADSARPPSRRRRGTSGWLVPALVGVVAVLVTVIVAALEAGSDDAPPADLATAAIEDAGRWSGVNYRGAAPDLDGTLVEFDITVTATGARGALSRGDGRERAEVVQDRTGVLFKGNAAWWEQSHPEQAEQLADTWVSDPGFETSAIDPILQLAPTDLPGEMHAELPSLWQRVGERSVDGRSAIVLSNGFCLLIVTAEEPHQLLAVDPRAADSHDEPVRIALVEPEPAAEITNAAADVRAAESPRTLVQQRFLRPQADIRIRTEPMCRTPTCTASFVVTNTGEIPIEGRFEMTADGNRANSGRLDLQPGESATFDASAPNRFYNGAGTTGTIHWTGQVIPD